jgi:phage shock protein E
MFSFLKKLFGAQNAVDYQQLVAEGAFLVDVRTPAEVAAFSLANAKNIPLSEVSKSIKAFEGKSAVIVFCASGARSARAAAILKQNGIQNVHNGGGIHKISRKLS